MTWQQIALVVAAVLAVLDLFEHRGHSALGWAVLAICAVLLIDW